MFDLMHTPDLLGLVKYQTLAFCADKYILIELSNLVDFGYDLSDLGVGEMILIFCGKHHIPMTRIQASDPGLKCPLVQILI